MNIDDFLGEVGYGSTDRGTTQEPSVDLRNIAVGPGQIERSVFHFSSQLEIIIKTMQVNATCRKNIEFTRIAECSGNNL